MELKDQRVVCGSELEITRPVLRRHRAEAARDRSPCIWERETVDFGDWVS